MSKRKAITGIFVVTVRCTHCMYLRIQWGNPEAVVFTPDTLKKYVEETCYHCGQRGMEIYVGDVLEEDEEQLEATL